MITKNEKRAVRHAVGKDSSGFEGKNKKKKKSKKDTLAITIVGVEEEKNRRPAFCTRA